MSSDQYTDIFGVSDYLGITVPTIKRRLAAGRFPVPTADAEVDWWTIDQLDKYRANLKRQATRKRNRASSSSS